VGTNWINSLSGFIEQHAPSREPQWRANTPSSLPSSNAVSRLHLQLPGHEPLGVTTCILCEPVCHVRCFKVVIAILWSFGLDEASHVTEQWICMKCCLTLAKMKAETLKMLKQAFGYNAQAYPILWMVHRHSWVFWTPLDSVWVSSINIRLQIVCTFIVNKLALCAAWSWALNVTVR
jgi:hypothetical protein